ncbi:integrin alpha-4-like [Ornithodoros turicata]|uniref:integrin alpha-4-like n=1 Tax=Ornithodoros turicata TaxID=34597 RepID=UPI003139B903
MCGLCSVVLLCVFLYCNDVSWGYNVDTDFPIVVNGVPGSDFGFTVAFHRDRTGKSHALVGAIRANSSLQQWRSIYQPGAVFRCPLLENGRQCSEVVVERGGNRDTPSIDEALRYYDLKDNMTLGMTLESTPGGRTVVCGPLWKNQKWQGVHLANGVCYVLDRDLKPLKKLLPLVKRTLQVVSYDYYYYAAESGFSATFTQKGDLILGTPGFLNWKGTLVRYRSMLDRFSVASSVGRHQGSYIGYSVTSGRFFRDEDVVIATGAPRGNTYKGEVYLVSSTSVSLRGKLLGSQMGEYFGASLLAIDLDKAAGGFDDLLVGAPQFSQPSGMDEGRVYVYISTGTNLYPAATLEGGRAHGSRFGTSIANIGDINMDGIDDIAVGAPYEDDVGAVYIYHGASFQGSRTAFAQRISASDIATKTGSPIKGLGISIAPGYDADANHYNDVLIGAYQSDSAVLLRTRPLIRTRASVEPDITMISPEIGSCEVAEGQTLSCFNLKLCLGYAGRFAKNELDFETELTIDAKRMTDGRPVRGFMHDGPNQVSKYKSSLTARAGHNTCVSRRVYLHATFLDPVIPFEVRFSHNLKETGNSRWCSNCPILDASQQLVVSKTIPYKHGCREDDECKSDLQLEVDIGNDDPEAYFVVGEQSIMSIAVKVHNKRTGDPAYLTRVVITAASTVRVVNKDRCSVQQDKTGATMVVCDAGNPLRQGVTETFNLKLDLSQVLETFALNVTATTTSEEIDAKDNVFSRVLPFVYQADIGIYGTARPSIVEYNTDTKSVLMEHSFLVTKQYASPVQKVEFSVHVPYIFSESAPPFSRIRNFKILQGDLYVPGSCRAMEGYFSWKAEATTETTNTASSANGTGIAGRVQRSADPGDAFEAEVSALRAEAQTQLNYDNVPPLNCHTALCQEFLCTLGPFLPRRANVAQIVFYVLFDMEEFKKQAGVLYAFSVGTEGSVKISDNITFVSANDQLKEIRVATVLQKQGPLPAKKIAPWIIAASAFGGLIVFSLLLAALIHLGFFRRRHLEDMVRLRSEDAQNEWNEFMVTEEEVQAEKELFRKSMMMALGNGAMNFLDGSLSSAENLDRADEKPAQGPTGIAVT